MQAALNSSSGRSILGTAPFKIGRAGDNTLVITDPQSSSHHAEVRPSPDGKSYQIIDLNSTNGTFINEQRLSPHVPRPLNAGDVLRIGGTLITYGVNGGYIPTVVANSPNYEATVMASAPIYPPNGSASSPSYDATVAASAPTYPATVSASAPIYPPNASAGSPNYDATVAASAPTYPATVSASAPNYDATIAASAPTYPATVSAAPPNLPFRPQQPAAYGNFAPPPQQPSFAHPAPAYPQSGYPLPRKFPAKLVVAIVVIVLLVIGSIAGIYAFVQGRPSPQHTLQTFCADLKSGDYQDVYSLYSGPLSQAELTGILKLSADLNGGVEDCTVGTVTQDTGATAHGSVVVAYGNRKTEMVTPRLVFENGSWKINQL